MEIGTEISQKIRSAIKAKLIELGAYVDDELPDYIMVMVANKKSEAKMTEDLCLFLGSNTEKFSSWLHNLLTKLQTISADPTDNENIKTKEKEKKAEKRKRSDSLEKPSGSSSQPDEKKRAVEKVQGTVNQESEGPKAPPAEDEEQPELLVRENTDEFSEEFKEEEKKKPVKPSTKGFSSTSSTVTKVIGSSARSSIKSSVTQSGRAVSRVQPSTKSSTIIPTREDFFPRRDSRKIPRAVTSPIKQSTQKRKIDEKESGVSEGRIAPKRKPASFVGSVIRKYTEVKEEEEEYDPYNPAVGSVASVIKVTARRSSVPKSLQANRSLLLKAMTEAEKSISAKQKERPPEKMVVKPIQRQQQEPQKHSVSRMPPTLSGKIQRLGGLELISKSRRQEILQRMQYTVQNDTPITVVSTKKVAVKPEYKPTPKIRATVSDSRLVKHSKKEVEHVEDKKEEQQEEIEQEYIAEVEPEVEPEEEEVVVEQEEESPTSDEQVVEEEQEEEEEEEEEGSEVEHNVTDPEIQQLLEGDEDQDFGFGEDDEEVVHDNKVEEDIPRIQKSHHAYSMVENKRIVEEKEQTNGSGNPKFIVTLDGVDPDAYDLKEELSLSPTPENENTEQEVDPEPKLQPLVRPLPTLASQSKVTPPKIKPFYISLKDTDDEEEEDVTEDSSLPTQSSRSSEKCKFWPACANGNACQYIHPSVPCKTFPYCKFGDKCLYIHPNCKYDARCTRKDCPFTHASKRGNRATVIHKIVPVPVPTPVPQAPNAALSSTRPTTCRFYPNCTNMSCPFTHPKPCRFGVSCMNKALCRFHHPALPGKNKLTWSAKDKKEPVRENKPGTEGTKT